MNSIDWRERHTRAYHHPNHGGELMVMALLRGVREAIDEFPPEFPDAVASPAFGDILEGIRTLLNFDTGRLDPGTIDGQLCDLAVDVGWDLDMQRIVWDDDEVNA